MDNQPNELIMKQILEISSIEDTFKLLKDSPMIYKQNRNLIFRSLIKNKFGLDFKDFNDVLELMNNINSVNSGVKLDISSNTSLDNAYKDLVNEITGVNGSCSNKVKINHKKERCKQLTYKNTEYTVCPLRDFKDLYIAMNSGFIDIFQVIAKCIEIRNIDLLFKLLNKKTINYTDEYGYSSLMVALLYKSDHSLINKILDLQPNINTRNIDYDESIMIVAVIMKTDHSLINRLLTMNPDLSIKNKNGKTAYDIALKKGYSNDILEKLKVN